MKEIICVCLLSIVVIIFLHSLCSNVIKYIKKCSKGELSIKAELLKLIKLEIRVLGETNDDDSYL